MLSFSPKLVSKPKSLNTGTNTSTLNLIYFDDIAKFNDENDYIEQVRLKYYPSLSQQDARKNIHIDFAIEILINSRIAVSKYGIFKKASYVDVFAFALIVILLIIA